MENMITAETLRQIVKHIYSKKQNTSLVEVLEFLTQRASKGEMKTLIDKAFITEEKKVKLAELGFKVNTFSINDEVCEISWEQ